MMHCNVVISCALVLCLTDELEDRMRFFVSTSKKELPVLLVFGL